MIGKMMTSGGGSGGRAVNLGFPGYKTARILFYVVGCLLLSACVKGNPYVGVRVDARSTKPSHQCIPESVECAMSMGTVQFRYRVTQRGDGHLLYGVMVRPNFGDYDAVLSRHSGASAANATLTVQGQLFLVHTGLVVDTVEFSSSGPHNVPMIFMKRFNTQAKFQSAFIGQHETVLENTASKIIR